MSKRTRTPPISLEDLIARGHVAPYESLRWERTAADADTDRASRRIARRLLAQGLGYAAASAAVIYLVPRIPVYMHRGVEIPDAGALLARITMPPAATMLLAAVWVIAIVLCVAALTRLAARRPRRGAGAATHAPPAASAAAGGGDAGSRAASPAPQSATRPPHAPPPPPQP